MTPLVAHADWSVAATKRWMSVATPSGRGCCVAIGKVGELGTLLPRLRDRAASAPLLFGVDAPIGLPGAYQRGSADFSAFLDGLAAADPFFSVCDHPSEICVERPFYPRRSHSGVRRRDLLDGLGLTDARQLLRRCEAATQRQAAAAPMFWTLGASQVGKGALCLWRDLLIPARRSANPPSLWPFDGSLAELLEPGRTVVAETYPAHAMRQIGLGLRGSKRRQSDRLLVVPRLREVMQELTAEPNDDLSAQIDAGFGSVDDGEDRFDSLVGLLGMLQVVRDPALDHLPEPAIRQWEGWILGRPLSIS